MIDDRRLRTRDAVEQLSESFTGSCNWRSNRAGRYLSQAFEEREAELPWAAVEPGFDEMREDEEFRSIVDAVVRSASKAVRV